MAFLSRLPYKLLIPLAILLGLAPFLPQPHLVEKIGMLMEGSLSNSIDIFDLVWHGWPIVLLGLKLIFDLRASRVPGHASSVKK